MTDLRITIKNTSDAGGSFTTPFYFGFHNGDFDLFDVGEAASPGLEALAEDGNFGPVAAERLGVDPDSQGTVVAGAGGPIAPQEVTSGRITVTPTQTHVSFGAMILPSNDAFVGTDDAVQLFSESGRFLGAQTVVFEGGDVYDAGTEFNTEEDAAFLNQTGPNTGLDEGGVVRLHEGFNGSEGNPDGILGNPEGQPGAQNVLGGTTAPGAVIDPVAGDFTREGAQIATIHINTVVERNGSDQRDFIFGRADDDIIEGNGGRDFLFGGRGWDVISGGDGNDKIFGGAGDDEISGDAGRDWISGGRGDDRINGGEGDDDIRGGAGDDMIAGGAGRDWLSGGHGDDSFLFAEGDGRDKIWDFNRRGDDQLVLQVEGVSSFADVLDAADQYRAGVSLDFGGGDSIFLRGVRLSSLDEDDFLFV